MWQRNLQYNKDIFFSENKGQKMTLAGYISQLDPTKIRRKTTENPLAM